MGAVTDPFRQFDSAWMTAFWKWEPHRWGCVGWTFAGSRKTILDLAPDPFPIVIYTTKTSPADIPNRGRVMGMYALSHEIGHRDAYSHPASHDYYPERWQHAARAVGCWEFPDRPPVDWLEPEIYEVPGMARTAGIHGKPLSPAGWTRLKSLEVREVPFYRP